MSNLQNSLVDGVNSIHIPIKEWQAASLILNFNLQYVPTQNSGEMNFLYSGNIKNMTMDVRYKNKFTMRLRGSLQKFEHGNNSMGLSWVELDEVKKNIGRWLHIDGVLVENTKIRSIQPLSMSLSRVELGLNMEVGIDDLHGFLAINLIQHKKVPFTISDGLVYACKHENYYLKLYPKGQNLLRVEMVFLTNELRKYKVVGLEDLTKEKIRPMASRLKKEFSEIVFGDGIDIHLVRDISKKEELCLLKYTNGWRNNKYLEDLQRASLKEGKRYKQRMYRLKKKCKQIFVERGAGYTKILVDTFNQQIDSCFD